MTNLRTASLSAMIGLSAANFIYQALATDPSWVAATERTFFQCIAILLVWATVSFGDTSDRRRGA